MDMSKVDPGKVPPGQRVTDKFPVMTYSHTPRFDPEMWRFSIFGLVKKEVELTYKEFRALPVVRTRSDFHCVTHWSRLENDWEGVPTRAVLDLVELDPSAKYVMIHSMDGYSTNLSLEDFLAEGALFAWAHDGRDLDPDHGWPLRLVVPHLYGWKSAKWANAIEVMDRDKPGFWERYGYHMRGDPWKEERYG